MTENSHDRHASTSAKAKRHQIRWDAVAATIASFTGFLALLVAGYTLVSSATPRISSASR